MKWLIKVSLYVINMNLFVYFGFWVSWQHYEEYGLVILIAIEVQREPSVWEVHIASIFRIKE
jgi:hypothetical protein